MSTTFVQQYQGLLGRSLLLFVQSRAHLIRLLHPSTLHMDQIRRRSTSLLLLSRGRQPSLDLLALHLLRPLTPREKKNSLSYSTASMSDYLQKLRLVAWSRISFACSNCCSSFASLPYAYAAPRLAAVARVPASGRLLPRAAAARPFS